MSNISHRGMLVREDAYSLLLEIMHKNPTLLANLAHAHRLDADGRCHSCHAGDIQTGRTFGCLSGDAARRVQAAQASR